MPGVDDTPAAELVEEVRAEAAEVSGGADRRTRDGARVVTVGLLEILAGDDDTLDLAATAGLHARVGDAAVEAEGGGGEDHDDGDDHQQFDQGEAGAAAGEGGHGGQMWRESFSSFFT